MDSPRSLMARRLVWMWGAVVVVHQGKNVKKRRNVIKKTSPPAIMITMADNSQQWQTLAGSGIR